MAVLRFRLGSSEHVSREELLSLTVSADCPCYGGFGCRRGDGACEALAKQSAGAGEEGAHAALRLLPSPAAPEQTES